MFKFKVQVLCVVLLMVFSAFSASTMPHYAFKHITGDEGLSSSYVKAIAQDCNGFIWLGTKNGLDRYDGISLHTFNCWDNEAHRGNNNISAIYEDSSHNLWIGTDRGVYNFNPRTETFTILDIQSRNGIKAEDWVESIDGDDKGNIWILVPNQGVFRYNGSSMEFYNVTAHNGDKEKLPLSLIVSEKGKVYVGTNRQGLYFYDEQINLFRRIGNNEPTFEPLHAMTIQYLTEGSDGSIYASSRHGEVMRVDTSTNTLETIPFSKAGRVIMHSMASIDDEVWLGTSEGIYTIKGTEETEISRSTMGTRSLSDNTITSLFMDRDHNVWAGSMFGGANFIQRSGLIFEKYGSDITRRGLTSNHIRGMAIDSGGRVWIGTEESGLNILDPLTGNVKRIESSSPDNKVTLCVKSFGDKIYAGFANGGCIVIQDGQKISSLSPNLPQIARDVYNVFQDSKDNLWVAGTWGLFRKDKGKEDFRQIEDVGYSWIYDILEDSHGKIWIASMGEGIWSYEPATGIYHHYAYDENHSNGLCSNSISGIMEDSKGRLWFSTDRGGLAMLDAATDAFISYGIDAGFPDDTVYDVLEDRFGNLWFGTNRGLVKFNPDNGAVKTFTKGNNQFNYRSAVKTKDGRFYMGGIDGLLVFNPEADNDISEDHQIFFTDFNLTGTDFTNNKSSVRRHQSVLYTDKLVLNHDEGNFSIALGFPAFTSQGNKTFYYRLLPVSKEWSVVTDPSNLTFAGISPGDYKLEVRTTDDEAPAKQLAITVLSPWYQTWWADCLYLLAFALFIALCWAAYRRNQMQKLAEKEEIFTIEKEKELYKKKMQFFTEIAHEIRTPLTLIGTPLEAIEEIGVKDSRIERYLRVIRQNTSRLLDLTGQILDFQKMGSETHSLKFEITDINTLIQDIVDRFEITISNRSKELLCKLPPNQVLAKVDKDAVIKILSNLFNNAMKYSDHHIEITLTSTETNFEVSVKSDGEKIAGENRYKIFEPFYQVTNKTDNGGVGIGLPLCRTLAHLHGGSIELLDDKDPDSNTFKLTLPLKADLDEPTVDVSPVKAEYVMEDESPVVSDNSSYSLLFVDDNDEMRDFLYDQLSKDFAVDTACNGKEALEKMKEHQFDIVVTDIMMPEMDGYDLCKAIKADPNISPIPVVFLTAKNDLESKVRALECGGESYIEKPFSMKYFRQQIKSLLDNRRHERKAFLNKPFFSVDNMKVNKADEEFMNKVIDLINENIANENFNVESMADIFCMSRSSLLRKIKTLFNLSPVELIRLVRLKKAAELIQNGKHRIGDICFMVGINSQSYFSRLFFKQFGITPKAFEKQCQEKTHASETSSTLISNKI